MRTLLLTFLIPLACMAGESRWSKLYKISVAAVIAGSAADAGTSWGKAESNPLLQSPGRIGTFGAGGLAIKGATVGGVLAITAIAHRRFHQSAPAAIGNFGMAAAFGVVAAHNSTIARPR